MTDKVQKILSEIATRKLCTMDEHMAFYNDAAKEDYRFLSDIDELIKALQEEPVSEKKCVFTKDSYTDEDRKVLCDGCEEECEYAQKQEPVSKVYTFKSIPRLLDMIQPSDRANTYITKLADSLDEQGYHTDAKIVRESIKIMNGDKVAMATMDEEPASKELEEAASKYAKSEYDRKNPATLPDRCKGCYAPIVYAFKAGAQWQKTKDESTTEDLGKYINELSKQFPEVSFAKLSRIAVRVAKWQKQQDQSTIELAEDHAYFAGRTKTIDEIKEALLSEVLPCFMHGGEADEVVAKLDEVLNQKK